jgi:hypothetical protein
MAVMLKQVTEVFEVDTEDEATELVAKTKEEFNVIKSSITYKFRKKDQREYYIVELKKSFVIEEME